MWVWEAFDFLSRQRLVGANGPLPVSATDLHNYCMMAGLTRHWRQDLLLRAIPELDAIYLKHFFDEQEKRMSQEKRKADAKARTNHR